MNHKPPQAAPSEYISALREKIGNSLLLLPSVAGVIANNENQILLQKKSTGAWSLPAGMIEPGESPASAVKREVLEETGLAVTPVRLLGVFSGKDYRHSYPNGHQVEYTVILFQCEVIEDSGLITDPETDSLHYFDKPSLPELALPYPVNVLFGELESPYWES